MYALPMTYQMTHHARTQAQAKGFLTADVYMAASQPSITYANGRFEGQMRHIRGNIVAVVKGETIITVYENVRETDLRPDQKDRDALRYGKGRGKR